MHFGLIATDCQYFNEIRLRLYFWQRYYYNVELNDFKENILVINKC